MSTGALVTCIEIAKCVFLPCRRRDDDDQRNTAARAQAVPVTKLDPPVSGLLSAGEAARTISSADSVA